jgi:ubiquinone biosynthesis protein
MLPKRNAITRVTTAYRHMGRITELMKVMVKFGFGDLFANIGLRDTILKVKRAIGFSKTAQTTDSRPKRLRLALEEMGLVFIKLGQYLSTRHDVLPMAYIEEFSKLQDNVPPIPFDELKKILSDNIDTEAFKEIDEEPLAAASVGQVHAAVLADGTEVVFKLQRPGLRKQAQTDIEILLFIASQVEKYNPSMNFLRPVEMVQEFKRSLLLELDYRQEANNILHFNRLYAVSKEVKVPILNRKLSTDSIIVMERLKGVKFDDANALKNAGIDRKALAKITSKAAIEQIMTFGFFHGDPHPGNLYALPGPKIAFMDFGLIGHLSSSNRDELLKLALGAVTHNPAAIARAVLRLSNPDRKCDREKLETDINHLLDYHLAGTLKDIDVNSFVRDILDIMSQNMLKLSPDLLILAKALVQFERLGIMLDPDYDVMNEIKPILVSIYRKRYSPAYRLRQFIHNGEELIYSLQNIPKDLTPFLDNLKTGSLKSDIEVKNLNHLNHTINNASQRLSFSLILSSLVIGSSLVIAAEVPPLWNGVAIMGLIGIFGALILALWLLVDFLRYRN